MGIPRLAQIKFPAVEGDAEDGDLKVNESGGGVDANIARWYGQLSQPDGTPTAAVGVRELLSAGNINIHFIDALGTFAPPPMMAGSAGAGPRPNWRLFGAIIETPRGLLTFKATGPDKTMSANREKMRTFLTSLRAQ